MSTYLREKDLFPPFQLFGNLYFVGSKPASAHLIDTGEGLILLDCGYPYSFEQVKKSMEALGFDPKQIRYLLLTHGHIDHFGAAKAFRELSGAKIALGEADKKAATGEKDLSFATELGMEFTETFQPDLLLHDGDEITLGNTTVRAVATPGHTEGAMSYFFDVSDGQRTVRAALHGGSGMNSLAEDYLIRQGLPLSLREDFRRAMHRLNEERVELFVGNHLHQNRCEEKYERLLQGEGEAFLDPEEWKAFNLSCIAALDKLVEKESERKQEP